MCTSAIQEGRFWSISASGQFKPAGQLMRRSNHDQRIQLTQALQRAKKVAFKATFNEARSQIENGLDL